MGRARWKRGQPGTIIIRHTLNIVHDPILVRKLGRTAQQLLYCHSTLESRTAAICVSTNHGIPAGLRHGPTGIPMFVACSSRLIPRADLTQLPRRPTYNRMDIRQQISTTHRTFGTRYRHRLPCPRIPGFPRTRWRG